MAHFSAQPLATPTTVPAILAQRPSRPRAGTRFSTSETASPAVAPQKYGASLPCGSGFARLPAVDR
jgi:hypothetical protein